MSSLKITQTSKGNPKLLYDGFSYRKGREMATGLQVSWRCLFKNCNASLKTNASIDKITSKVLAKHNHPSVTHQTSFNVEDENDEQSSCLKETINQSPTPSLTESSIYEPEGNNTGFCSTPVQVLEQEKSNVNELSSSLVVHTDDGNQDCENAALRDELKKLRTEWEAAVNRSIENDIKLLNLADKSTAETGVQTETESRIADTNEPVNCLSGEEAPSEAEQQMEAVPYEIIQDLKETINKLKEDNKTFTEKILLMSTSIEALEADNLLLRNEKVLERIETDKWRARYDELYIKSSDNLMNDSSSIGNNRGGATPAPGSLSSSFATSRKGCEVLTECEEADEAQLHMISISQNRRSLFNVSNSRPDQAKVHRLVKNRVRDFKNSSFLSHKTTSPPVAIRNSSSQINFEKITIFADSHGKNIVNLTAKRVDCKVTGMIKPGAKFEDVASSCEHESKNMSDRDLVVLMGGGNDMEKFGAKKFLSSLKKCLYDLSHVNIILMNVPRRYDLPISSNIHHQIERTNLEIARICRQFKNVRLLDISNIGRRFHTRHGLHLNSLGKRYISDFISGASMQAINEVEDSIPLNLK